MRGILSIANMLFVVGGLTLGLLGFSGPATASPTCWGAIPPGSAHQPFSNGSAGDAGCTHQQDTSDTSMADLGEAGSWPGSGPELAAAPWTTVP